jgi:N,N-dimethylformamidase
VQNASNPHIGPVNSFDHDSHVEEPLGLSPASSVAPCPIAGAHEEIPNAAASSWRFSTARSTAVAWRTLRCRPPKWRRSRRGRPPKDPLACWDNSQGYDADGVGPDFMDTGLHRLTAFGLNRPIPGMTRRNRTGKDDCVRLDPGGMAGGPSTVTHLPIAAGNRPCAGRRPRICARASTRSRPRAGSGATHSRHPASRP